MNESIGILVRAGTERVLALPEGFEAGPCCLKAKNPSWEACVRLGKLFGAYVEHAANQLPWQVGDFINIVEGLFPDRYTQVCDFTGWTVGTAMNYASAARNVPPENRVFEGQLLPIRHGMDVSIIKDKHEQAKIIRKAMRMGLTSRETRRLARGDPDYRRPALPDKGSNVYERVLAAFERHYAHNEGVLRSMTLKDGHEMMWKLCTDLCMRGASG